ncbi:MAG: D-alanyl-D-alanine carboxypeptidase [Ruminococcaceae bacterium]|nr:D-alanyl-D-alanine carboxypeptidase [Oscillospiraceae bacterium]
MRKSLISLIIVLFVLFSLPVSASVPDNIPFDVKADSAVLMDYSTGTVLYSKNADLSLPPASVTKIMTLLLFMEEVEAGNISLDENIQISEYAASMGGSQVYLEAGESMQAEELLKCVIIASANDAAVALAEKVAGSEDAFVSRMNEKAAELGMNNTHFENVTGLDDDTTKHLTSAYDIALMSRALLSHGIITKYSTIWMDTIRNGEFGLTNTNRLVRFYDGATGLKTGSTSKAGFCMSATAKRDGLHLIAVIMGSDTRDIRNEAAKQLLDYGFAKYSLYENAGGTAGNTSVIGGVKNFCTGEYAPYSLLLPKGKNKTVQIEFLMNENISAPVSKGDKIGTVRYLSDSDVLHEADIVASEDVAKISFWGLLGRMFGIYCLK